MDNIEFNSIKIGLASPEMIRDWSYGEVVKPETINYRTLKPEPGGLFCEKIFGPTRDGACSCGKYKNYHSKETVVCDKCGVEVTTKKVRRERMGHIELACPVSHIWYFKAIPSRLSLILELTPKQLENVLYLAENIVLDPGTSNLTKGMVLTEKEYREQREYYGDGFRVGMGAEAILELLRDMDMEKLSAELREKLKNASGMNKTKIIKRLEVVEAFRKSGNKPEWMILTVLPVIPPDIRPMVQLDGGRFASSDLNELYRRVIARNNMLKRMMEQPTPGIILNNQKRMLQQAVDALIDNGRHGKPVTGPSNREYKPLSEMLRGKQGRFRQNLLGKRVDYSGRSVIVVGPSLKIYQCGLPREMALELFKPFVVKRLEEIKGLGVKDALKKIEKVYENPFVWDALEHVIKEHPVLLNRAPTLHRLSIQAFEPVLVDGRAIKLHPLVCTAFNADFDGDQMPVHVPLSAEAQAEARFLMLSANNLLKPMDGRAVAVPSQDMVLGSYYLTMERDGEIGEGSAYRDMSEAMMAYANGSLGLHAKIKIRRELTIDGQKQTRIIDATLGRLIFNGFDGKEEYLPADEQTNFIPQDLGFAKRDPDDESTLFGLEINMTVGKKELGKIIDACIKKHGLPRCADMLDAIKARGYKYSTKASFSICVTDMTIPKEKPQILAEAQAKVDANNEYFAEGFLTNDERRDAINKIWSKATDDVTAAMLNSYDPYNSIKIIATSGARGSNQQIMQLSGMRGLMFNTDGTIIELPIKSNFREGMKILEYFMGAKGSRKSLSDTALRTADSGYLTRRLVDVSQDVIIREECCDSTEGSDIGDVFDDKGKVLEPMSERILGRYTSGKIVAPDGTVLAEDNVMITEEMIKKFEAAELKTVRIRSIYTCHAKHGICAHCYGADLSNGKPVQIGEAVGIIAAQSIGEPGTQLTMRTFHSGGVAGSNITQGLPRVEELFEARTPKNAAVLTEFDGKVRVNTDEHNVHTVDIISENNELLKAYTLAFGVVPTVTDGDFVKKGDALTAGSKAPADIMRIQGLNEVYMYLTKEVQKVYRSQSCNVNDKHIEVIARQMTRKMRITESGDTDMLVTSIVDKAEFERENKAIAERIANGENVKPAEAEVILLGITKAASMSESFLSAASFQTTTQVLTDAAIHGKEDFLLGLKENVIIGKLIPAGTGMGCYHTVDVEKVPELVTAPENVVYSTGE